jgi:hypothetical protein
LSVNLTIAGQTFAFPTEGEDNWGQTVTQWATAVSTQLLQRTGGAFTLSADVNFGASFATIQAYLKSRSSNIATAEFIRLAVADAIAWRNNANSANLKLAVNASDQLTFDGAVLITTLGTLTASRALVTNSGGDIVSAITTATEIGYVNGVTSAIQTQLNAKIGTSLTSANIIVGNGSNIATAVAMSGDITIANTGATSYNGTVPLNKGGTGQTTKAPAFDALSPTTTRGDLITRDASTNVRLALGASGTTLRSNGTDASWGAFAPIQRQVFTSSGTFNVPALVTAVKVTVIGGGGGSGGCQTTAGSQGADAGGGGGGGTSIKWVTGLTPGGTVTVTVGTGGTGGSAGANNGGSGGTSSFGAHCTATGGGGGNGSATSSGYLIVAGGAGGTGASGDLNFSGGAGGNGFVAGGNRAGQGFGGDSFMSGRSQPGGADGAGYGGGASGPSLAASSSQTAGAAGANGVVIVEWIAI